MVLEFLISAAIGLGVTELLTSKSQRPASQQRLLKQARDHLTWNKYKEAIPILMKLTKENPFDPEYYALLACGYDNLANIENRLDNINKALESIEAVSWLVERGADVPEHVQGTLAQRKTELEVLRILLSTKTSPATRKPRSKSEKSYSWNDRTMKYRCEYCLRARKYHYCKTLKGIKRHLANSHFNR